MSFSDLRLTLIQRFATEWDGETPVDYQGVPFTAPTNEAYARVLVRKASRETVDIAATVIRYTGFVVVDLFAPQDGGIAYLDELGDLLADTWDHKHFQSPNLRDVETQAVAAVDVPEAGTKPGWVRQQYQIPFSADYFRGPIGDIITDAAEGILVG